MLHPVTDQRPAVLVPHQHRLTQRRCAWRIGVAVKIMIRDDGGEWVSARRSRGACRREADLTWPVLIARGVE